MTPGEARKNEPTMQVKANLELHRVSTRKNPEIVVGDKVKLFKKKPTGAKEDTSYWLNKVHTVERISTSLGQKYYHVSDWKVPLLRHEILRVPNK